MKDVIIVGGGPAGCFTGLLLLQKGHKVVILEAQETIKRKICGEFLSPAGVQLLEEFEFTKHILDPFLAIHGMKIYSPHLSPITGCFSVPGRSLSRDIFDEALRNAFIRHGGVLERNYHVQNVIHRNNSWYVDHKEKSSYSSSFLIGADGRLSKISKLFHRDILLDPYEKKRIAFHTYWKKNHTYAEENYSEDQRRFGEMHLLGEGMYVALNPIKSDEWNVSFILSKDQMGHESIDDFFLKKIKNSQLLSFYHQKWPLHTNWFASYPLYHRVHHVCDPQKRWALVGDAAGCTDPLLGEGIFGALKSAKLLVDSFPHLKSYHYYYRHYFFMRKIFHRCLLPALYYSFIQKFIHYVLQCHAQYPNIFMDLVGHLLTPRDLMKIMRKKFMAKVLNFLKCFLLLFFLYPFFLVFNQTGFGQEIMKDVQSVVTSPSYEDSKKSEDYVSFSIKSTKIGLFTSHVKGYVKTFKIMGKWNEKKQIRELKVIFNVLDMDTDNKDRNEKMWNTCLNSEKFKTIEVFFPGPVDIDLEKEQIVQGEIYVMGSTFPIDVHLKTELVDPSTNKNSFLFSGTSILSFKKLQVPDPSIFVAKVADEIEVAWKIKLNQP